MYLAELNIGRLVAPVDDPKISDFVDNIERVNGIAKRSPGFVWMMEGSGEPGRGNLDNCRDGDPQAVTNLSVWKDLETLENFVWNTVHRQFYMRRAEWFEWMSDRHFVMWWVDEDHRPTIDEALQRLEHLRQHGASEHAFNWGYAKALSANSI